MDKRRGILNVSVSVTFKLASIIMSLLVRRILIQACGNEINGLNALYLSIIGFMSVAELGVGSAIIFCMYKPIVEGDQKKVSALYYLFRKLYMIIGAVILACGLGATPFVHIFAKDYAQLDVNLHSTFILMLVSTVLTYFYGAKTALFNAYKNNYITTAITYGGLLLQYGLQILVLKRAGTFEAYLICRIVACLVQWGITELIARRKYTPIITRPEKIDGQTRKEITKNIKAMFMHKIGTLLVNTLDNVIIAAFVGVIVLGEYSNYTTILSAATGILKMVFSSLTSIFGHLYVQADRKTTRHYSEAFYLLNFVIGVVFFMGYYAVCDNLVSILFSPDLTVAKTLSLVITLNGFVQFMRESTIAFRDATGTFYHDRWKPLVEGLTNAVLSILFVKLIGTAGVIIATILTNLLICHIVEPYVLYRFAYGESPKRYYLLNYSCMLLFGVALLGLDRCMLTFDNPWKELLVNGTISVGLSVAVCLPVLLVNRKRWLLLKNRKVQQHELTD